MKLLASVIVCLSGLTEGAVPVSYLGTPGTLCALTSYYDSCHKWLTIKAGQADCPQINIVPHYLFRPDLALIEQYAKRMEKGEIACLEREFLSTKGDSGVTLRLEIGPDNVPVFVCANGAFVFSWFKDFGLPAYAKAYCEGVLDRLRKDADLRTIMFGYLRSRLF